MNGLIYNQRQIPRQQWRYGLRSSAATGCGWIAVYNVLRLMGQPETPETLIRYFERQLPLIHGNAGTTILGPAFYFRRRGFRVQTVSVEDRFDALVKESDGAVLYYRWRRGWRFGAHFVAVQYREGRFVGYNTFRNSQGPDDYGQSLAGFLKRKGYYLPVLTAVFRK